MTTISATIIADSISDTGKRITTMQLKYPRYIHAEFMTHRIFSRNAGSSRATPTQKLIEAIEMDLAYPVYWGRNQAGMQAREEMAPDSQHQAILVWEQAARSALSHARSLMFLGAHKQIVNRILEPYAHISVVVTSTEWDNFWGLRLHEDADPAIQQLAKAMYVAYEGSTPKSVSFDHWHLPYVLSEDEPSIEAYLAQEWAEKTGFDADDYHHFPGDLPARQLRIKISVARCARVSFKAFDGTVSPIASDVELFNKLMAAQPLHASPAEHQAQPSRDAGHQSGNFTGWHQYRKSLVGESRAPFPENYK